MCSWHFSQPLCQRLWLRLCLRNLPTLFPSCSANSQTALTKVAIHSKPQWQQPQGPKKRAHQNLAAALVLRYCNALFDWSGGTGVGLVYVRMHNVLLLGRSDVGKSIICVGEWALCLSRIASDCWFFCTLLTRSSSWVNLDRWLSSCISKTVLLFLFWILSTVGMLYYCILIWIK